MHTLSKTGPHRTLSGPISFPRQPVVRSRMRCLMNTVWFVRRSRLQSQSVSGLGLKPVWTNRSNLNTQPTTDPSISRIYKEILYIFATMPKSGPHSPLSGLIGFPNDRSNDRGGVISREPHVPPSSKQTTFRRSPRATLYTNDSPGRS